MTDLIERLRAMAKLVRPFDEKQALTYSDCANELEKAADEIERLQARVDVLEGELADLNERYTTAVDAWNREVDRNQALFVRYQPQSQSRDTSHDDELDNERARDIHSCGPHCQRMECQQRREIERLTKGRDIQKDNAKRWEALAMQYKREIERLQARVEALEGVREDFKQFAAYIAVKGQYDIFRKTEEYAAFFDNLAATEQEGET